VTGRNATTATPLADYLCTCEALLSAARRLVHLAVERCDAVRPDGDDQVVAELERLGVELTIAQARLHRVIAPRT